MKKLLCAILVLLLAGILPLGVLASSVQAEGTCGEGLTWTLRDHTLTISGSGDMEDGCPWEEYKDEIRSVVLTGGVSRIGAKAFYQFEKLKDIDFGDSLREIGPEAFYDCNRIQRLVLPATFRSFEAKCFQDCDNLTLVYCYGPMPHFRDSCLWTVGHIDLYYPLNNPWPSEYVSPLLTSYGSHLSIYGANPDILDEVQTVSAASVDDTDRQAETTEATVPATTAATEPPTVPTTAPTTPPTQPPTEAPTVPPTQAPTAPPTEAPTQAPTVPATEAPTRQTEPPLRERNSGGDGWIGLLIIIGVLTLIILGVLLYRISSHRGGRYS